MESDSLAGQGAVVQDTRPAAFLCDERNGAPVSCSPSRRREMNKAALIGNLNSSLCLSGFHTKCQLCLRPECLQAKIS